MFKGHAELDATRSYLKSKAVHPDQQRIFSGAAVSSIALGTYLGGMDFPTDQAVTKVCMQAVQSGINFFDSAINYRGQRGERSLGEAFRQLFLLGAVKREEIFVSTKGGFVPYDREPVPSLIDLFEKTYVQAGLVTEDDLVSECHCMHPKFLEDQLERSRKNLGLETIDLYYIHNPETQLEEFPERIFYERLFDAFKTLEKARVSGRIMHYGLATWDGFREARQAQTYLNLEKVMHVAQSAAAAGSDCGLSAIQLPFSLAMLEARFMANQSIHSEEVSPIEAAVALGIDVAISAPLLQGQLAEGLPDFITKCFPQGTAQSEIALHFATSVSGVGAAMVGMKRPEHLEANVRVLRKEALNAGAIQELMKAMQTRSTL